MPQFFFTFFTVECLSDVLLAAGFSQNPGPVGHWRLVTDVLSVTAGQVGHPISMLVEVKSHDRLLHRQPCPLQRLKGPFRPFLRREK
jgi:hypothetical protein